MSAAPLRRPFGCLQKALRQASQLQHPHRQQQRTYANAILKEPVHIPPAAPAATPRLRMFFSLLLLALLSLLFLPLRLAQLTNPTQKPVTILNRGRARRQNPSNAKKFRTGFAVYAPLAPGSNKVKPTHPHLVRPPRDPIATHHAFQIRKMDPSGARTRLFSKDNPQSARVGDILLVTTRRSAEPFGGVLIGVRRRGIETSILLRGQLTKIGTEMSFKVYSRNVTGIEILQRAKKRARRAKLTYLRQPKHEIGSVDHLVREWKRNRNVNLNKGAKKQKKTRRIDV